MSESMLNFTDWALTYIPIIAIICGLVAIPVGISGILKARRMQK